MGEVMVTELKRRPTNVNCCEKVGYYFTGKGSGKLLNGRSDGQLRTFLSNQLVKSFQLVTDHHQQSYKQVVTRIVAKMVKWIVNCTHSTQMVSTGH